MRRVPMVAVLAWLTMAPSAGHSADLGGLQAWAFLIGDWTVTEKRYDFDSNLLQTNVGHAHFSSAMHGTRLQEIATTARDGDSTTVLHLFVWNPRTEEIEITRTDSDHFAFNTIVGTMEADAIVLREKHPNPDSEVSRRFTYRRMGEDQVTRTLEFSTDGGETWFVRNEWAYRR